MTHKIAVIAFEGISIFHLSIPSIVFGDKILKLGVPRYDIVFCAETPGTINTLSNVSVNIDHDLSVIDKADTIIVPAWTNPSNKPSSKLLDTIKKAYGDNKRTVGLCLGHLFLQKAAFLIINVHRHIGHGQMTLGKNIQKLFLMKKRFM